MRSTAYISGACALIALFVLACARDAPEGPGPVGTPYPLHIPSNFPPMPLPPDNPLTVEGVQLGRHLFYEKRLSGNDHQSCATCHSFSTSFTDGVSTSTGIDGVNGTRNAMALVNLGWQSFFFWDGRASTLEQQALEPVRNPIEMHDTWPAVEAQLQADPAYPPLFQAAFGTSTIDSLLVAKAIAQFLRTLISGNSPYDKWKRGEGTLSADALAGYVLFTTEAGPVGQPITLPGTNTTVIGQGGADCFHCHTEGLFTDGGFHNNALDEMPADSGRALVTHQAADLGRFKVPTLRNIGLTRPYMHDGRFFSIEQVLDHYDSGGHASATADPLMKFTDPGSSMGLTAEMRTQLKAFLDALVDYEFVGDPAIRDPGPP
ncbi:MAG: cytochrome-c peroxidase [Flavobacteriales bacterium]|nr:cytochrome-c peroxidase [Flavobacteriales bacterium]MCB9194366.1 cytochrome-c peroxidase [Flavobacteriales bacterium]